MNSSVLTSFRLHSKTPGGEGSLVICVKSVLKTEDKETYFLHPQREELVSCKLYVAKLMQTGESSFFCFTSNGFLGCLALSREDRGKKGGREVADMTDVFEYLKFCHMENELYSYCSVPVIALRT
jgi:hypothetical protein